MSELNDWGPAHSSQGVFLLLLICSVEMNDLVEGGSCPNFSHVEGSIYNEWVIIPACWQSTALFLRPEICSVL